MGTVVAQRSPPDDVEMRRAAAHRLKPVEADVPLGSPANGSTLVAAAHKYKVEPFTKVLRACFDASRTGTTSCWSRDVRFGHVARGRLDYVQLFFVLTNIIRGHIICDLRYRK